MLIDKVMLPGYTYKTNFSSAEFLVDINNRFVIIAKPMCLEDKFYYDFALDTEFLYEKEITYNELVMIKNIIDILEENRSFVLSKLKKYTAKEYLEEQRIRKKRSEEMLEELKNIILE